MYGFPSFSVDGILVLYGTLSVGGEFARQLFEASSKSLYLFYLPCFGSEMSCRND